MIDNITAAKIYTLTGLDVKRNKALKKYINSGMAGVMQEIYDTIMSDPNLTHISTSHRRAMAVLVYNRHINGSHIPGCVDNNLTGEFATRHSFQEEASAVRLRGFREVRQSTLDKYATALELIDNNAHYTIKENTHAQPGITARTS